MNFGHDNVLLTTSGDLGKVNESKGVRPCDARHISDKSDNKFKLNQIKTLAQQSLQTHVFQCVNQKKVDIPPVVVVNCEAQLLHRYQIIFDACIWICLSYNWSLSLLYNAS